MRKVISGGQTGADRGGLDAALDLDFPHGGWCPYGRRAEDGRIPDRYELVETASTSYKVRTRLNITESEGTVIFVRGQVSQGSALTSEYATRHKRPWLLVDLAAVPSRDAAILKVSRFIAENEVEVLNIAGSRESVSPGIQEEVRSIMRRVLQVFC